MFGIRVMFGVRLSVSVRVNSRDSFSVFNRAQQYSILSVRHCNHTLYLLDLTADLVPHCWLW